MDAVAEKPKLFRIAMIYNPNSVPLCIMIDSLVVW